MAAACQEMYYTRTQLEARQHEQLTAVRVCPRAHHFLGRPVFPTCSFTCGLRKTSVAIPWQVWLNGLWNCVDEETGEPLFLPEVPFVGWRRCRLLGGGGRNVPARG